MTCASGCSRWADGRVVAAPAHRSDRVIRIGMLVPAGNPTVEPECYRVAPSGVTVHFSRLGTPGVTGITGGADGMEARTRAYLDGLPDALSVLRPVEPAVIVLAHTAVS